MERARLWAFDDGIGELDFTLADGHVGSQILKVIQRSHFVRTIEGEAHWSSVRILLILQAAERGRIVAWIFQIRLIDTIQFIVRYHHENVELGAFRRSFRQQHVLWPAASAKLELGFFGFIGRRIFAADVTERTFVRNGYVRLIGTATNGVLARIQIHGELVHFDHQGALVFKFGDRLSALIVLRAHEYATRAYLLDARLVFHGYGIGERCVLQMGELCVDISFGSEVQTGAQINIGFLPECQQRIGFCVFALGNLNAYARHRDSRICDFSIGHVLGLKFFVSLEHRVDETVPTCRKNSE